MAKTKGTDYRLLFERDFIGAWDLQDQDVVVTIDSVKTEEITGEGGRKERCPVLRMRGKKKALVLNITNARAIASMHGKTVEGWTGKRITLFPTTCQFGRNTVDCIRVRLLRPDANAPDSPDDPDADPGNDDPGPPDDWRPGE
jgi:hypothetical protein